MRVSVLAEGVRLRAWPGSASSGARGVCLIIPGQGYSASMPLLFWPATALAEQGWAVFALEWDLPPAEVQELEGLVEAAVCRARKESSSAVSADAASGLPLLVVAKSLGTRLAPWACRHRVPGVWLTPLMDDDAVRGALMDGLAGSGEPARTLQGSGHHLVVGGTTDPQWFTPCSSSMVQVLEIPQANHSLQVEGSWRRSVEAQKQVVERIIAFASQLLGAPDQGLSLPQ